MNGNLKDVIAKPILIPMKLHTMKWRRGTDMKGKELARAACPKVYNQCCIRETGVVVSDAE